jgi:ribosomal-protein-alanine N-acetyltransferase
MEKAPYQPQSPIGTPADQTVETQARQVEPVASDWRQQLPVMIGRGITLRELRRSDAASLCALMTTEEVGRFIASPPETVEAFEAFIEWTHHQRACGQGICFAVVPDGCDAAVGVFQIRELEPGFVTAEWEFAIGSDYWGSGLFEEGALLVIDFAFAQIGTHRLEARAAMKNGRGNGALAKLGAGREAILRRAFLKDGEYLDQNLWTIVHEDWLQCKAVWGPRVH